MPNWRTWFIGQDEYVERQQQPGELDHWPAQPPLVTRSGQQPIPPFMTPQDLQAAEEVLEIINAMDAVDILTRKMHHLSPRDTETARILGRFREAFA